MEKITYTEIFYSLQGEGRWAGVPSVFFRTYGCNFRCRKFGRPRDEVIEGHNPEVVDIIEMIRAEPEKYKRFEDLPLVTSGCDTYASIYPEFKHFNEQDDVDTIVDKMHAIIPGGNWNSSGWQNDDVHLVITGGEPLLGYQKLYPQMLERCRANGLRNLTFETNGTQELYPEVRDYLFEEFTRHGRDYDRLTFSVSPKLPCSGEAWDKAINAKIIKSYEMVGMTYVKFVVATRQDVEDAERAVAEFREAGFGGPIYLMPVGGVPQVYNLNTQEVARLAMERGWRYSPRLQVDIWRNAWGT
jgi:organic radical activating enzyme